MVDVGYANDQGHKSTAYDELSNLVWQRDGDAEYQLTYLEHMQKLQRCYTQSLDDGWTKDEMKSEQSLEWLRQNVEYRVGI